ncbi:type 1 glutamine amidotransferase domain-containing protein [Pontibacter vulgaris]|uniref:type 1 glutamine amidotransferase domain-containing protein n=1 Tax=Pontibacter vulgaris TaxID=2905679 RepID=UPI001FA7F837|nr:type 1 glutamine amidotransferase domain-containing protein [Pontibacter vulgaris]
MANKLEGKKIAILVEEGFEQVELTEPRKALEAEGAQTHIISTKSGEIKSWNHTDWGDKYKVDKTLDSVNASDYNALLLPGGVMNPDKLRVNKDAVAFVNKFMEDGKPVAAICHAPWTLIETGKLKGKKITSYHTLKTDLKNAGADWVDEEVVVDNGLVTSRKPDDIPAFNRKMIEEFAEGRHDR